MKLVLCEKLIAGLVTKTLQGQEPGAGSSGLPIFENSLDQLPEISAKPRKTPVIGIPYIGVHVIGVGLRRLVSRALGSGACIFTIIFL